MLREYEVHDLMGFRVNGDGSVDLEAMMFPTRCLRCRKVHDAAKVTPTARYSDCTMWRCPNCNAEIDDRAGGWGGSEPVR